VFGHDLDSALNWFGNLDEPVPIAKLLSRQTADQEKQLGDVDDLFGLLSIAGSDQRRTHARPG
jgi:hypothetical protein